MKFLQAGLVALAMIAFGVVNAGRAMATPSATPAPGASTPCVAILVPNVEGVQGDASNVATGIQQLFSSYLTGPSMRVIALEARLPALANEEAKQKECDHILQATFTKKHKSGTFGKVLGAVGTTAAWTMPYGGTAGSAIARSAAITGAETASAIAANTRAKDEIEIKYQLVSSDGKVTLGPKDDKAKASADGEDIVTPLVRKASELIVADVMKK